MTKTIIALANAYADIQGDHEFAQGQRAAYAHAKLLVERHGLEQTVKKLESYTKPSLICSAYEYGLFIASCCAALLVLQHWMYTEVAQ